jgi:hypothetical protein
MVVVSFVKSRIPDMASARDGWSVLPKDVAAYILGSFVGCDESLLPFMVVSRALRRLLTTHPLLFRDMVCNVRCGHAGFPVRRLLSVAGPRLQSMIIRQVRFRSEPSPNIHGKATIASLVAARPSLLDVSECGLDAADFRAIFRARPTHVLTSCDYRSTVWSTTFVAFSALIIDCDKARTTYTVAYGDGTREEYDQSRVSPDRPLGWVGFLDRIGRAREMHVDGHHTVAGCKVCARANQWVRTCAACAATQCTSCRARAPLDHAWLHRCAANRHHFCHSCHRASTCTRCSVLELG